MRKNVWLVLTLVLILPAMLLSVGCSSQAQTAQPEEKAPAPESPKTSGDTGASSEESAAIEAARALVAAKYDFRHVDIYYEFDSAALLPSAQEALTVKAELLNSHPEIKATIGGHCDERGTDAYNMALGQRRADAARAFLINLGVGSDQLNTISYGEEQPDDPGHNEAAWARNRRAEFSID